jgi:hypothetical protein
MSGLDSAVVWAKAHPIPTAVGAAAAGLLLYYVLTRGGAGSSSAAGQIASANATATSAYYAAEGQQGAAGDQLQQTMIEAQAATAINQSNNQTSVTNNTTWANADLAETQSTNQAALAAAPYATEDSLISTLGAVASLPPTTSTSTSKSSGFLGIGGGTKTTTTVTPNPAATSAASELQNLETLFYPSNG